MKFNFFTYNLSRPMHLILVCFVSSLSLCAQEISNTVDTTNIRIGEQIIYKINIKTDSLGTIRFPESKDFLPFEVINESKLDTNSLDKKYIISKQFALTHFDSGVFYIPAPKIQFLDREVRLDSFRIKINSVVIDTTKQGLYGIKPIMKSKTQVDFLYWLYVILALSLIAFFIYYRNQIFSFFKIHKLEVEYFTPYEKAIKELSEIKKLRYDSNIDVKNYYSNLTFVVRNFLNQKIINNALECTTKELIIRLNLLKSSKKYNLSNPTIKNIDNIFSRADLVKFAKYEPDYKTALNDLDSLEKEIDNIKLILPEPTKEELQKNLKIQEDLRRLKQKKRNKKIVVSSVLSLFVIYLTSIIVYGFTYVNDTIFRNQNLIFLESKEWVSSSYGAPPVFITTPKVLNRNIDSYLFNVDNGTTVSEFNYENVTSPLNITITNIKLTDNSPNINLQQMMNSNIETIEKLGVKNIITKFESFQTPNGAEGLLIYGSADFPSEKLNDFKKTKYKIFGFVNNEDFKQVFLSWQEDDDYIDKIINTIVDSIELIKSKKQL
ncbi:MAG: Uncharacterised protein [Flavobacteriaceae bacterium]|nr:MAG: Uncharacterised protein [Flavobacteriaceae bacterium]